MAQPLRHEEDVPIVDPAAIEIAYRRERARRRARLNRQHERRLANARFVAMTAFLLVLSIAVIATIWYEVQNLFGL